MPYLALQWLRQAAIDARRRDRRLRYLAWSVGAGVASALMIALAAAFTGVLWTVGLWWLAIPVAALLLVPPVATTAIRLVLVPAGAHRLAYYAGRYSRPGPDPDAYAQCVAAWACRGGAAIAWVEARRDARKPLGDAEVAATALIAAGRGDPATARTLFGSIEMLVELHPAVRELAGEWLACDAAERGAWPELVASAAAARWPATPLTYLLEGLAARHAGVAGAPSDRELWARWLVAPRRRTTWRLLRELRALGAAAPQAVPAGDLAEPTADAAGPLPRAVAAILAFEASPPSAAALAVAVGAWDAALADADTRTWLARRALELDAPAGAVDRALDEVAAAVADELARRAEAAQLAAPAATIGPVSRRVARRLRHGRLDGLEAAFARWAERRRDDAVRSAIDEWREFIALRDAYDAAATAGGHELRRLAFPHAFAKGNHMAAWLWNKREEYALSHAISAWLLAEALAVGDAEAIELGHRNCALSIPTRLGRIQP